MTTPREPDTAPDVENDEVVEPATTDTVTVSGDNLEVTHTDDDDTEDDKP